MGRPCAGKTGTSNDSVDAWFVGYTTQMVAGVWVGYDDRTSLGNKVTGGNLACPIWTKFMKEALEGYPIVDFYEPQNGGIEWTNIDPKTGLLALSKTPGKYEEAFLLGTMPTLYCTQRDKYTRNFKEEDQEEGY